MKKWLIVFGTISFIGKGNLALAQWFNTANDAMEHIAEGIIPMLNEEDNVEEIMENLFQFYTNPIDLNKATYEDLQALMILSHNQIKQILDYRENYGNFINIHEIQAIPGLSPATARQLLPFITIKSHTSNPKPFLKRVTQERNNQLIIRHQRTLEPKRGYQTYTRANGDTVPPRYAGSPDKIYARFRTNKPGDFSIGFTTEKDPGEQIIWDPQTNRYGMDFWSCHFMLQNRGPVKNFILGDYQIQFGQGLLLGAGFNMGKGGDPILGARRSSLGIRPYTSVMESGFLRGTAFTLSFKNLDLTGFYSNNSLDGRTQDHDTIPGGKYVTSISYSGLHRTEMEINHKGSLNQQTSGINLLYQTKNNRVQLGATGLYNKFSLPIYRPENYYNQFYFSGNQSLSYGTFYSLYIKNFHFFGELAQTHHQGKAHVHGILVSLHPKIDFAMLYRNYDPNFHTFFSNAFSENTLPANETGWYKGIKILPIEGLTISAFWDRFHFPYTRFRVNTPSHGFDGFVHGQYLISKQSHISYQWRKRGRERNHNNDQTIVPVLMGIKHNHLINLNHQATKVINLRTRIQFSSYEHANEKTIGYAIFQDLNLNFNKLSISSRFGLFDTDDFENRQFAFERDVLYNFSIPAFHGKGSRSYIMAKYKLHHKLSLWVKYARTRYHNQTSISSGNEMISGDTRTDLTCQILYKI
jgi:hypothetical protein